MARGGERVLEHDVGLVAAPEHGPVGEVVGGADPQPGARPTRSFGVPGQPRRALRGAGRWRRIVRARRRLEPVVRAAAGSLSAERAIQSRNRYRIARNPNFSATATGSSTRPYSGSKIARDVPAR